MSKSKCKWGNAMCSTSCIGLMLVQRPNGSQLLCDRPIDKPIVLSESQEHITILYKKWIEEQR
jgi:hypothetical protein